MPMECDAKGRKVLRTRTRSGRLVTLGTARIKDRDQPFASKEKVQATLNAATAASKAAIRRHRAELLDQD